MGRGSSPFFNMVPGTEAVQGQKDCSLHQFAVFLFSPTDWSVSEPTLRGPSRWSCLSFCQVGVSLVLFLHASAQLQKGEDAG